MLLVDAAQQLEGDDCLPAGANVRAGDAGDTRRMQRATRAQHVGLLVEVDHVARKNIQATDNGSTAIGILGTHGYGDHEAARHHRGQLWKQLVGKVKLVNI